MNIFEVYCGKYKIKIEMIEGMQKQVKGESRLVQLRMRDAMEQATCKGVIELLLMKYK